MREIQLAETIGYADACDLSSSSEEEEWGTDLNQYMLSHPPPAHHYCRVDFPSSE